MQRIVVIMKKPVALALAVLVALAGVLTGFLSVRAVGAPADHVVIYEMYGGGGNSGAVFKNDYIVLHNPTAQEVSLDGWSVQYASKTGKFNTNTTALAGSIRAGGYYLVQEGAGAGGSKDLPAADASGSIAMSGSAGKVALAKTTQAVSGKEDANVIDFVGYGAAANEYEGTAPTVTLTNKTSAVRAQPGVDTDDNSVDFAAADTTAADYLVKNSAATPEPVGPTDKKVANPTASPAQGAVALGTPLSLSCTTGGAVIHYQINAGEQQVYSDTNKPVLSSLPATVKVWATKEGMEDSEKIVLSYTGASAPAGHTIAEARADGNGGNTFTVTGVATTDYLSSASGLGVYVQDETAGIMLFGQSVLADKNITAGDTVTATGTTAIYQNKQELMVTDVKVTDGDSIPAAKEVGIAEVNQNGGLLVRLSGVSVSDMAQDSYSNATFTLTRDGASISAKLDSRRGDNYAALAAKIADGDTADVVGVLEGSGNSYTLQLRSAADAVKTGSGSQPGESVAMPTATPDSGEVEKGAAVTLSCATEGAVIKYQYNGGAEQTYSGPVVLDTLPAELTAWAEKGDSRSVKAVFQYTAPFTGTYNTYFGQLHAHTTLSDGAGSPEDAFAYASKAKNLDFLALTDHSNSFEGSSYDASLDKDAAGNASWKTGKDAAANITAQNIKNTDSTSAGSNFLGVFGFEMTWSDGSGHINTFNTPGFENRNNPVFANKKQSASNPSGLDAYYKKLQAVSGSVSQFNHPGTTFGTFYDYADYSPATDARITMIEVGNGEGAIGSGGYFPSYSEYTRALDKGWHVAPTNNQDNHKGKWGDANTARSVILAPDLSEQSLYDAMRARRVYATEDNDLSIYYTLNNAVMGSELSEAGDTVHIQAKLSDPTDSAVGKVEVIVNGGRTAASKEINASSETVSFDLPNEYSYYYLRVTQPDKNIAVTAPVWTNKVESAGISDVTADTALPIRGEALGVTANLYNNETSAMTVKKLEYSVGDRVIRTVNGGELEGGAEMSPLSTRSDGFSYTPDANGTVTIKVKLTAALGGVEKEYNSLLTLQVADPAAVTKVLIDGTHDNDYVNGYYAGNMDNLIKICAAQGIQARIETQEITPEMLAQTQLLLVSAPLKTVGSNTPEGMQPSVFSPAFAQMVADYAQKGGTVIVCGLADYQDAPAEKDPEGVYTSAAQVNSLLQAMGASTRLDNSEVLDQENNDGSSYRLKLKGTYNQDSQWLAGADPEQQYSVFSGCSVTPGANAQALVNGFATTYAINSRKSNSSTDTDKPVKGPSDPYRAADAVKQQGDVTLLATEPVGQGRVFVSGTVFVSNFEVQAEVDNWSSLPYLNYNILNNILGSVKKQIPTTAIADVRKNGKTGDVFAVEGTVTAGSETPTAFYDTIYIQDETGGINVYPVANGAGLKIGQKVRVVGHVDAYQGDKELKIGSGIEGYTLLDSSQNPVAPAALTAAQALDYDANGGLLAKVRGKVSNIQKTGHLLDSFDLTDSSGKTIRVLMNNYITPDVNLSGIVQQGAWVDAVGVVYTDPEGVCLRVRDRNEITAAKAPDASSSGSDSSESGSSESDAASSGSNSSGSSSSSSSSSESGSSAAASASSVSQTTPGGGTNTPATGEAGSIIMVGTALIVSALLVISSRRRK